MDKSEHVPVCDPNFAERLESFRGFIAVLAGASLAGALTIVGAGLKEPPAANAMLALVSAIPLLALYLFVQAPGHHGRFQVSGMMKITTLLGILLAIFGLSFLFSVALPGAGILFGVLTLACAFVCMQAQDRANSIKSRNRLAVVVDVDTPK